MISGFSFRRLSEMRVSRLCFSWPYQRFVGLQRQGGTAGAAVGHVRFRGGILLGATGA